jgi:hypothetical protein
VTLPPWAPEGSGGVDGYQLPLESCSTSWLLPVASSKPVATQTAADAHETAFTVAVVAPAGSGGLVADQP